MQDTIVNKSSSARVGKAKGKPKGQVENIRGGGKSLGTKAGSAKGCGKESIYGMYQNTLPYMASSMTHNPPTCPEVLNCFHGCLRSSQALGG